MTEPIVLKLGQVCTSGSDCRRIPHNFQNKRGPWQVRWKWNTAWKGEVSARWLEIRTKVLASGIRTPLERPQITFTFYKAGVQFDWDGLRGAAKPLLDALTGRGIGLIVDDSPDYIPEPVYKQMKVGKIAEERVEIQIST
ncbi:MAG: hypothetical protein Q8L86_12465 [Vicinamibacterales bacterium]|nr:hypothetical protein [Vicinamibacterales bacterium]